jgi:hypothetical protein
VVVLLVVVVVVMLVVVLVVVVVVVMLVVVLVNGGYPRHSRRRYWLWWVWLLLMACGAVHGTKSLRLHACNGMQSNAIIRTPMLLVLLLTRLLLCLSAGADVAQWLHHSLPHRSATGRQLSCQLHGHTRSRGATASTFVSKAQPRSVCGRCGCSRRAIPQVRTTVCVSKTL